MCQEKDIEFNNQVAILKWFEDQINSDSVNCREQADRTSWSPVPYTSLLPPHVISL